MEMTIDQVVGVVPMGNGVVAAAGPVPVRRRVRPARVAGRTAVGVFRADRDRVLVEVVAMRVVQVTVVQIVAMAVVFDGLVATPLPVFVVVSLVNAMRAHGRVLLATT
jgi:hypothetical protein